MSLSNDNHMSTYEKQLQSLHDILLVAKDVLKNANCLKSNLSEKSLPSFIKLILKIFNSILQILLKHKNMTLNSKLR